MLPTEKEQDILSEGEMLQMRIGISYFALNSLNKSKEIIATETLDAKVKANRLAMIDAMQVYFFQILVDSYGNVPYSQALQIEQSFFLQNMMTENNLSGSY
jgi:flagellar biosynthesis protein FliR